MRSAWVASAILAILCFGGVVTMLSQAPLAAGGREPSAAREATLDPAREPAKRYAELLPPGLENGIESRARAAGASAKGGDPRVLRLR